MYFIEFPVSATNIFPLSNSHTGAELVTEFNLRSRETVATDPSVKYAIGPSYTHSMDDFSISSSAEGANINSTSIQINPGRALVNGHYVELLEPIVIDLAVVNYKASQEGVNILKGPLAIGLVMMYSDYTTLAGSALVENADGYYEGVRVVIVPELDMKRPIDVPGEYADVNMHLLLGKFLFYSGTVSSVTQNEDKVKILDASRIGDISSSLSDMYISKAGLDPSHFYVFAGTGNWCKAEESLMIWDTTATLRPDNPHSAIVAHFEYTPYTDLISGKPSGTTELVVPHKQIDGATNSHGEPVYFADKRYAIPNATFDENSGGVVSPEYTKRVRHIEDMTNHFYRLPNGKMRAYIPSLDSDRSQLPPIPVGDGSATPIDVDEVFADINSALTEAAQLLGTPSDSGTASWYIAKARETMSDVSSDLAHVNDDLASTQLLVASGGAFDVAVGNAINAIDAQRYTEAKDVLANLTSDTSTGFPKASSDLTTAITKISAISSDVTDSNGYLSDASAKIASAYSQVGTAINLLASVNDAIENYIQLEVNKRADAITVLTSSMWSPGDYVLVGQDQSVGVTEAGVYPSTMYVVNYGKILTIRYVSKITRTLVTTDPDYQNKRDLLIHEVPLVLAGGVELDSVTLSEDPHGTPPLSTFNYTNYRGAVGTDYFVARYSYRDTDDNEYWTMYFYTPSSTLQQLSYIDDPILITGGVPFATENTVGGFYAVSSDKLGNGYVTIDDEGHLRVVDYNYLALGIEAQQLGQDITIGSGMDIKSIKDDLANYVNDRICYPNNVQRLNKETIGEDPHIIVLTLELPNTTDTSVVTIHDIGSRSGSSLYVKITGNPTSATTLVFQNCDKLRIDDDIPGGLNILLDNVNLYYSANVLNRIGTTEGTGITNLSLWYERYSATDPDLDIDGMTVTLLSNIENNETLDPWHQDTLVNDNHYTYALRSVTFASDGSIIGAGMLVGNQSTSNIDPEGKSIFRSSFTLPQSSGLAYPATKMTHQLKITGSFISCYWAESPINKYVVMDTNFSALTQKYIMTSTDIVGGSIAFYTDASLQDHIIGVADGETIDCWDLNQPHIFYGGAIE